MAQKSIESVIGKSILNDEFRQLLFEDPDKALAGFPLTRAKRDKLRIVDSETLETLASTLDQRLGRLRLGDASCLRNGDGGKHLSLPFITQGE
jgi:hypothetical protein